jgi:hypothetical protein
MRIAVLIAAILVLAVVILFLVTNPFQAVTYPDPNCTPVPYQGDCPNL